MNATYRIRMTPRAAADLKATFTFVETDSPRAAQKLIRTILDAIDSLELFPYRFNVPRTGSVRGRQVRSMPVYSFLIRYRIDEPTKSVHILCVRHGANRRP